MHQKRRLFATITLATLITTLSSQAADLCLPLLAQPVTMSARKDRKTTWVNYRLMAYNVGCAANIPLGPKQIGQIADTIIDHRVDIAGLTELEQGTVWHDRRDLVAELGAALKKRGYPMHAHSWRQMPIAGGWFTPALFSRYPIVESGCERVNQRDYTNWCAGYVTVNVADNTPIRAYMTHIWPRGEPQVLNQAVLQHASLPNKWKGPKTIMGDFNLTPEGNLFKIVAGQGWRNSCHVVHGTPCLTVQGTAGISGVLPLKSQIDYIFGNNEIQFVDSHVGYYSMSDHWPIFAEVRVRAKGPPVEIKTSSSKTSQSQKAKARAKAADYYCKRNYLKAAAAYRDWEKICKDNDDAGFAAYSSAYMYMMAGKTITAVKTLERIVHSYPKTEWSTRAHQRMAFFYKESKRWPQAEMEFLAYLDGYYQYIHPDDVKSPAIKPTAQEIAECRTNFGKKTTLWQVIEEWSRGNPKNIIVRAAAYQLGNKKMTAGDNRQALPYFLVADPSPKGLHTGTAKSIIEMYKANNRNDLAKPFEDFLRKMKGR